MNRIFVSYEDPSYKSEAPVAYVRRVLKHALKAVNLDNTEISVSFVSDASIKELNREYRQKDEPTDVLSFVSHDADDEVLFPGEEKTNALGDLVVSISTLHTNSEYFKVSFETELTRVLIHGTLHLSGLDHETNDFATEPMLIRQEEILSSFR